jgi:ribosomal protein S18 acetylase RimI-like enzyme
MHALQSASPLAFPDAHGGALELPASLSGRGIAVRAARTHDIDWLRGMYRRLRAQEFAPMGWPAQALHAFLDQQFTMQHVHYIRHYQRADFLMVERDGQRLGRIYLQRTAPEHLLVDISLEESARGSGIGGALIVWAQDEARALGRGMRLHVEHGNHGARRLYERLGFVVVDAMPTHALMRWESDMR